MSWILVRSWILVLALLVPVAQSPPAAQPESSTGTSSISGRVIAAGTGKPLPHAQVRLLSEKDRRQRFAPTDAQGRYRFGDLAAGRYHVNVTVERYVGLEYGQRYPNEAGKPIDLRDGQRFERADFSLPRMAAIEGRLIDEFGDPAPNIFVQVSRLEFAAGRRRLMPVPSAARIPPTDDKGRFRVFNLSPGAYYVTALAGAFTEQNESGGFAATYYPGTPDVATARPVRVDWGRDVTNVDFALVPAPMARVSGIVVDANGSPVPQANLFLAQSDRAATVDFTVARGLADRSGTFTFRNVPPGRYVVQAFGRPVGGGNLGRAPFGFAPIAANGTDLTGLVVRIKTGSSVRGRIVFNGTAPRPADITVSPGPIEFETSPIGGGPPPFVMNTDSTFEVGNQFGMRVVRVSTTPPWIVERVMLGARDVTDTPIEFGKEDVDDLEITLTDRSASVTGGVSNADGTPAANYAVVVFAADKTRWVFPSRFVTLARPNQDGRFTIRALPPHDYKIVALPTVEGTEWQDPEFLERIWYAATPLTLGEGENKTIELKLTAARP